MDSWYSSPRSELMKEGQSIKGPPCVVSHARLAKLYVEIALERESTV